MQLHHELITSLPLAFTSDGAPIRFADIGTVTTSIEASIS